MNRQNEYRDRRACTSKTLKLGVLNVQGCSTSEEKREEIGNMFRKRQLGVLALSETKMRGKGEVVFGGVGGRRSGIENGRAKEGVAILVSEEVKGCVTEWGEVSARLMWVRLKLGQERWVIVSAYGPGRERDDNERDQFWNELRDCVNSFGDNVNVVVLGDLNARVGNTVIGGVVARYGVPGLNESGERLIDMCIDQELVVGNTFFKKKKKNKYTWARVEGGRVVERALMDYVLVPKKVVGRLLDVHVYRGEAGGMSDHYLVQGRLKVAGGRGRGGAGGREREVLKLSELDNIEKLAEYREKLAEEWERVKGRERGGVETEWSLFKEGVIRCAKEVCGMRKIGGRRRRGSEWWNEEMNQVVAEKRRAFECWLRDDNEQTRARYREKKREVKRKVREVKRRADARWGRCLTENFAENKKMFWKEVKNMRKEGGKKEETVKDVNGQMLTEEGAVNRRWAEHFEELLNFEDDREARITAVAFEQGVPRMGRSNEAPVTKGEVEGALKIMRSGKAAGLDGIAAECLKKGGVAVVEWLVRLLCICLEAGEVPADWRVAAMVPIYKGKGDKYVCGNFRGISLLSMVGKIYGRVLINRIRDGTEEVLMEEQCGFRRGRGCVDQVFVVRQVCEKYLAKGKDSFWAFMDLEKAYDRVDREAMWRMLSIYGVGGKLLSAVKSFYVDSRACVRVGNKESNSFGVKVGLRQGCVMSPWLFNVYMDGVVREVNIKVGERGLGLIEGDRGQNWVVNQVLFADDTALVADSEVVLQQLVTEFGRVCDRRKLKVNVDKSKVMRCTRSEDVGELQVNLGGERLEEVGSFRYLGSHVTRNGEIEGEVKYRVGEAGKVMGGMKKVWKNRDLGMRAKRGLYESVIVPTALYAAETWGMKTADKQRLDVLEMRCLRSMCGVTRWDRLRNEEVRRRTGVLLELSNRAEQKGLRWFGHVERMDEGRMVKRISGSGVRGGRPRGRPRFGWMEGVKRSLEARGVSVEQGRVRARDRKEWRKFVNA